MPTEHERKRSAEQAGLEGTSTSEPHERQNRVVVGGAINMCGRALSPAV